MNKHLSPVDTIGGMPISANYAADLQTANHAIPVDEARQMISDFEADIMGSYEAFPNCETFNAATIQALLAVPGTVGLRIYNGIDGDSNACFILAGVNADGTDIIMDDTANGMVAENGQRYPPKPKKPTGKKPD